MHPEKRSFWARWPACFLWVLILTILGLGQAPSPPQPQTESHLATFFPAAAGAAAPAWVQPGTRLTYYGGAAIIPDENMCFFRDEGGDWVDEEGKRYRGEETEGHGGVGYTQVTVAALDSRSAVLDIRVFGISPVSLLTTGCCVGPPGAPGDYWVNPQVLRQIPDQRMGRYRVIRCTYPLAGGKPAIRFHYQDRSTRYTQVFDLETGALLHSSVGSSPTLDQSGRGGQLIAHCTLIGTRQIQVPWAAAPPPDWTGSIQNIRYQGQEVLAVTGASTQRFPGEGRITVTKRGPGWLRYLLHLAFTGIPGMPPATFDFDRVSGPAQFGGLWIPPGALAALRPGQVLDRDPTTGFVVSVDQSGDMVIINESGPVQQVLCGYNRATGMLAFLDRVDQSSQMIRTQIQLRLAGFQ